MCRILATTGALGLGLGPSFRPSSRPSSPRGITSSSLRGNEEEDEDGTIREEEGEDEDLLDDIVSCGSSSSHGTKQELADLKVRRFWGVVEGVYLLVPTTGGGGFRLSMSPPEGIDVGC